MSPWREDGGVVECAVTIRTNDCFCRCSVFAQELERHTAPTAPGNISPKRDCKHSPAPKPNNFADDYQGVASGHRRATRRSAKVD